jgi:hypothetical protein
MDASADEGVPPIPQEPFSVEDPQVHAAAEAAKQA